MSFVSWQYPLFLGLVAAAYWALPRTGRWALLMAASYVFYASWDVRFLALILSSTAIDYFCGLAIANERRPIHQVLGASCLPAVWLWLAGRLFPGTSIATAAWMGAGVLAAGFPIFHLAAWRLPEDRRRRAFLGFSVVSNLAVLMFFKYAGFFAASFRTASAALGLEVHWKLPEIVLPIAISFYTFQSISYAVDIHRGRARPARHFLLFSAYLAFFPQLVSGPIERAGKFLPQFEASLPWRWEFLHGGLRLLLVGLFKKLVVADNCALVANHVFDPATPLNAGWAILGVVAFAFQIYGDFSGYTDLARGSSRLLGIELSANFRFPYFATGPSDFWQRWHITLSTWFRDYVYIPLGGNRGGTARTLVNLWITMVLAGLWHGASWTFLLWGAYHALLLSLYRVLPPLGRLERADNPVPVRIAAALLMFVFTLGGWALFRCTGVAQLSHWFGALGVWSGAGLPGLARPAAWVLLHVVPLLLWQAATRRDRDESETGGWNWVARGLGYAALVLMVGSSSAGEQEFLYFQF